jgi:hypothetical protein
MFGKKKNKQTGIADDLYEFLEEADKLYIRAFETRSIGLLKDYFTRDCCLAISRWIVAEASSRYFSEERFRNTTWEILEESSAQVVLRKQCVYRDVRLTASRSMKISDDYEELWTIEVSPEEYWVSSVVSA